MLPVPWSWEQFGDDLFPTKHCPTPEESGTLVYFAFGLPMLWKYCSSTMPIQAGGSCGGWRAHSFSSLINQLHIPTSSRYVGPNHHLFQSFLLPCFTASHLAYGLSEALRYTLALLPALLIPEDLSSGHGVNEPANSFIVPFWYGLTLLAWWAVGWPGPEITQQSYIACTCPLQQWYPSQAHLCIGSSHTCVSTGCKSLER